mgnify:CR=1
MRMMQGQYTQHQPASLRQAHLQGFGPVRDTPFRHAYGMPLRNSRSPPVPAVVPSQQYMLGSQCVAYTEPSDGDPDTKGEDVRYRTSP